jgi:hypothetical protein
MRFLLVQRVRVLPMTHGTYKLICGRLDKTFCDFFKLLVFSEAIILAQTE